MAWKETIEKEFIGAQPGSQFTKKVTAYLDGQGFTAENTIFGNSTCPDEINRAVTQLGEYYGENFPLGGLAGYPFAGVSGFNAFAHHAPDMSEVSNLLVIYGPHLGVSADGELGKVLRRGMKKHTSACGSAVGAYNQIKEAWEKGMVNVPRFDGDDQQQYWIRTLLTAHMKKFIEAEKPLKEIVDILWMAIDEGIESILNSDRTYFAGNVALIGGIQINTPIGEDNYFLPKRFDIINMQTKEKTYCLEKVK